MNTTHHPRRLVAGLAAAAVALATLAAGGTATARPGGEPGAAARAADRGLRAEVAELGRVVGPDGGGIVVEHGEPVALVTDADDVAAVRAAGGTARVVEHTAAELDGIVAALDRFAGSGSAGRVQSWGVDVAGNRVVVTTTTGARDAATRTFLAEARRLGDAVVVVRQPAAAAPVTTDSPVYGGQAYAYPRPGTSNGRCSVGFHAYDRAGRYHVLTAGHCSRGFPRTQRKGYRFGRTHTFRYPGADWGVFSNDYPTFFTPQAATAQWNGYVLSVPGGWLNPAVGTRDLQERQHHPLDLRLDHRPQRHRQLRQRPRLRPGAALGVHRAGRQRRLGGVHRRLGARPQQRQLALRPQRRQGLRPEGRPRQQRLLPADRPGARRDRPDPATR